MPKIAPNGTKWIPYFYVPVASIPGGNIHLQARYILVPSEYEYPKNARPKSIPIIIKSPQQSKLPNKPMLQYNMPAITEDLINPKNYIECDSLNIDPSLPSTVTDETIQNGDSVKFRNQSPKKKFKKNSNPDRKSSVKAFKQDLLNRKKNGNGEFNIDETTDVSNILEEIQKKDYKRKNDLGRPGRKRSRKRTQKESPKPEEPQVNYDVTCDKWEIGVVVGYRYHRNNDWHQRDGIYNRDGDYKFCSNYRKIMHAPDPNSAGGPGGKGGRTNKGDTVLNFGMKSVRRKAYERCTKKLEII